MPPATFYRKLQAFTDNVKERNVQLLHQSHFVVWVDNFTKLFSHDYVFQEDGQNYSMYDLTVACAFLFPPAVRNLQTTLMFNRSSTAPLSHGATDDLVFSMPHADDVGCWYKRYESKCYFFNDI